MRVGSVALLYIIASYYPRRGGTSGDGVFCGIYYTDYSGSDSIIRWFIGAALDCFILFYAWWIFWS